jgi:hypothetical protein
MLSREGGNIGGPSPGRVIVGNALHSNRNLAGAATARTRRLPAKAFRSTISSDLRIRGPGCTALC